MHPKTLCLSTCPISLANLQWFSGDALITENLENLPATKRTWLLDRGSLTANLKCHFHDDLRVDVLYQDWQIPTAEEQAYLATANDQQSYIREVFLVCENTPMVFARTVIPATTLTEENRQLLHLGNQPLGELIFSQAHLLRSTIDVVKTVNTSMQTVWGRRSLFLYNKKPLAVYEFFLPALFDRLCSTQPAGESIL